MRLMFLTLLMASVAFGNEALEYFQKSANSRLLCKVSQYAYKIISQHNAEVLHLNGHDFFKLKGENTYLMTTGCYPLDGKREMLIF